MSHGSIATAQPIRRAILFSMVLAQLLITLPSSCRISRRELARYPEIPLTGPLVIGEYYRFIGTLYVGYHSSGLAPRLRPQDVLTSTDESWKYDAYCVRSECDPFVPPHRAFELAANRSHTLWRSSGSLMPPSTTAMATATGV